MLKRRRHILPKLALNGVTCPYLASVGEVAGGEVAAALWR